MADARVSPKQGNSKRAKNKTPNEIIVRLWSQKGGLSEGTTCQMDQVRRLKTGVMSGGGLARGQGRAQPKESIKCLRKKENQQRLIKICRRNAIRFIVESLEMLCEQHNSFEKPSAPSGTNALR